ncbi:MAG: GTP cyclohydrolase II [Alphaproteobacteria bacterium]|nr:GTP cyclohydrolase II [Alphaproteobacteria bacterium]
MTTYIATQAELPTPYGDFKIVGFGGFADGKEHFALVHGDVANASDVMVRVHSECMTGDVFGSLRCDCGPQLQEAMRRIVAEGRGAVLYLRQEGRGIGLVNKIRAYQFQDDGYDTVDANIAIGQSVDMREYDVAAEMLNALDIKGSVRLLTNNPDKVASLEYFGFEVVRVPIVIPPNPHNKAYLKTKAKRMGHQLVFTS